MEWAWTQGARARTRAAESTQTPQQGLTQYNCKQSLHKPGLRRICSNTQEYWRAGTDEADHSAIAPKLLESVLPKGHVRGGGGGGSLSLRCLGNQFSQHKDSDVPG